MGTTTTDTNLYCSGDKYGHVLLTGKSYMKPRKGGTKRYVECICKCWNVFWTRFDGLKSGHATSCGCAHKEAVTTFNNLSKHSLSNVWRGMISRCYDEKCEYYKNYGLIGVSVCEEWRNDFMSFYNWSIENGWEEGLELDKDKKVDKKPGKLYSPDFCTFMTHRENSLYTSSSKIIEYGGVRKNLCIWCEELGLNYGATNQRITRNNWSIEKAFDEKYRNLKTA